MNFGDSHRNSSQANITQAEPEDSSKAVHVHEHVHVNDHGFRQRPRGVHPILDVDVDVNVLVHVDGFVKYPQRCMKHTPEKAKLLLPPRQSRWQNEHSTRRAGSPQDGGARNSSR